MFGSIVPLSSKNSLVSAVSCKVRLGCASIMIAALTACGGGGGGGGGSSSCLIAQPNKLLPLSRTFSVTYKNTSSTLPVVVTTGSPTRVSGRCIMPLQLKISEQQVEEFFESDAQGIRLWGYKIKGFELNVPGFPKFSVDITATLESPYVIYDVDENKALGGDGRAFLKLEGLDSFSKGVIKENAFRVATGINDVNKHPIEFKSGILLSNGNRILEEVVSKSISPADPNREGRRIEFNVSIELNEKLGNVIGASSLNVRSQVDLMEGLGMYTRQLNIDTITANADLSVVKINGNDGDCDGYLDIVDDNSTDPNSPSSTSRSAFNDSCEAIISDSK